MPALEVRDIPISQLVPGELFLEAEAVEKARDAINAGIQTGMPRVTPIGDLFFVRDGNHRVMAMKQLGKATVQCRIQPHEPQLNGADYEADMCAKAVGRGYKAFVGIPMGSVLEKEQAYKEEDEEFDDLVLEALSLDVESITQIDEDEDDFFGDIKKK